MDQAFQERWWTLEAMMVEKFGKKPNMETMLYLIGINEFRGRTPKMKFSKEQKQDLMHVGVCTLLAQADYYELKGYDEEGWPHYEEKNKVGAATLVEQEHLLKELMLHYFDI